MQKHNFSAGPSILPEEVFREAAQAAVDFNDSGLSIMEISHRSADFDAVMEEAVALVYELSGLDDSYAVLFLSGGASTQFCMVPMNLLDTNAKACYIDTGAWSSKAIREAKLFGNVEVLASSADKNYTYIPKDISVPGDAAYLHITSNNTIYGTQFHSFPDSPVPVVCDMSSDIFSRRMDLSTFDLIYGGAQKNMGPAGTTFVIVKKDLLGKVTRQIPSMLDYRIHIKKNSMFNTPPVYPIYVTMLNLRWLKANGGVEGAEQRNIEKARILYDEIDRNGLFEGTVEEKDRSRMNACFVLKDNSLDAAFLEKCKVAGIVGLKGHRSVGGFRASMYNALKTISVQVLVDQMQEFERTHG